MKYVNELKEAIRALRAPNLNFPIPCFLRDSGQVEFHEEDYVGCGACFRACPAGAIEMQDVKAKNFNGELGYVFLRTVSKLHNGKRYCLVQEFDLATTGKEASLSRL